MKIGIYGGTFDPPHHGHLLLARAAAERADLDQVIFVPAAENPFKRDQSTTSADVRFEMVKCAIAGEPKFTLDDCELRRAAPSYTIDTVLELQEKYSGAEIFLIVGGDNYAAMGEWHRVEEIRRIVTFIWLLRSGDGGVIPPESGLVVSRTFDLSSTEIRNRVARGLSIRYMIPDTVRASIENQNLYRQSSAI